MKSLTKYIPLCAVLLLAACPPKQTPDSYPGADQTTPVVDSRSTAPAGPTAEELEARRLAAADNALLEASTLFDSDDPSVLSRIEPLLQQAMRDNPEHAAQAWFNIGVVRAQQGNTAGAREAWEQAGTADPTFTRGLANIGYLQMLEGNHEAAVATFTTCLSRLETEAGCNINLALLYAQGKAPYEGSLEIAMRSRYRYALGGDANNAEAYEALARLYFEQGQYALSRLTCENAILLGIQGPSLHNRLGLIALKEGDVIVAYQEFLRAVGMDPDFYEGWINVGAVAQSFRDYDTAIAAYERVLNTELDGPDLRLSYGAAFRGLEETDRARAEYEAVLAANPDYPGALFNLGILYQEVDQDYAQACRTYFRFLDVAPSGLPQVAEAENRVSNIRALLEGLAFLGEVPEEAVAACVRR